MSFIVERSKWAADALCFSLPGIVSSLNRGEDAVRGLAEQLGFTAYAVYKARELRGSGGAYVALTTGGVIVVAQGTTTAKMPEVTRGWILAANRESTKDFNYGRRRKQTYRQRCRGSQSSNSRHKAN